LSEKIEPSLESITVRGKYKIPQTDFNVVEKMLLDTLGTIGGMNWELLHRIGESLRLYQVEEGDWNKCVRTVRPGTPVSMIITTIEHNGNNILIEIECRPAMWFRISNFGETRFRENQVQEALFECKTFVKEVMSIFGGKEIEPVSVYPIIPRTEIKSRLVNLGLKKVVNLLDRAERHIVQNNFEASLTSSRTAFEKMVDWEMNKRGLEKTSNYKNDLERLRSRGHLDVETTKLLQSYYHCLSNIGVHERGAPVGIFEAQMGYGTTLIMLQYFANKLP